MTSKFKSVLFFGVAGAAIGFLWASGVLAFFGMNKTDFSRDPAWKPLTKEEYRSNQRRYPLYGAAAGIAIGTLMLLRRRPEK